MSRVLRNAFEREMAEARRCWLAGRFDLAFAHLERAHVLGQRHVVPHGRSHWWMLRVGVARRRPGEVAGQFARIVIGTVGSAIGIVPVGNTGGTDVSMFARRPIPSDLAELLGRE